MANFKNKFTVVDGIEFHSKVEARYYEYLKEKKENGWIADFELQPRFELVPTFKKMGRTIRKMEYIADFLVTYPDGSQVVIDIKGGILTDHFKLKYKLFDYRYPALELQLIEQREGKWVRMDGKKKKGQAAGDKRATKGKRQGKGKGTRLYKKN